MTSNNNNILEIPVTLKLKKNVAEVARMLAICYYQEEDDDSSGNTLKGVFDNFISGEVTKIIFSLAENPQENFPDSFKQYVKNLLKKEGEED